MKAPGDAQRLWFAEMVEVLREEWRQLATWDERIELCGRLEAQLDQLRWEREIQPKIGWCENCGDWHWAAGPRISVRAMILSLGRFGILSVEETKGVEKQWKKYRQEHGLDLYGQVVDDDYSRTESPGRTRKPELKLRTLQPELRFGNTGDES